MSERPPSSPRIAWPALVLPALFLLVAIPVILSGNLSGRAAYDQLLFHEPAIRQFVREWPVFDFSDYLSATTPGYHLILAGWAKLVDPGRQALQLMASLFTVGLLASLSGACVERARGRARRAGADLAALVCCLPAAASMYILFPGIWLLPDNIGWWLMLTVLLIALRPWTAWSPILAGLALLGLVFTRQSHLWAAGPIWAAAWLSAGKLVPGPAAGSASAGASPVTEVRWLFTAIPARAGALAIAVTGTIPAFLAVLAFYQLWGGLVPPRFQAQYRGLSPAAMAFFLSNLAIVSVFFGGFLLAPLLHAWKTHRGPVLLAGALGLLAAVIPPTSYDYDHGRSSGLWNIAQKLPVIAGHTSVLLLVLTPLGAVAIAGWLAAVPRRERWVYLAAVAGFIAAQAASPQLWQRYSEPMVLILVALWASRCITTPPPEAPGGARGKLIGAAAAFRLAGPAALALLYSGVSYRTIATAEPVKPEESPQYVAPAGP
ncbi:MAG: hypothetical protein IT436_00860 [Phycisphaerales bacterium]|nr:hypothetical protein [Phycisphaerales bacterium]